MAENVEDQLMTRLSQSQFFSLQLDESTDVGNEANLLCSVRYIYTVADRGKHAAIEKHVQIDETQAN